MDQKQALRKWMKTQLAEMTQQKIEDDSNWILQKLYEDPIWKKAKTVGITVSKSPEVDTLQIIRTLWELEKRVVVPKCLPKERKMIFRSITSFDQLESVYFGLSEPIEKITKEVMPEEIDLLIVPGLAYTKIGNRLGFGGGYFDRYLTQYDGPTISLAFSVQIVNDLPIGPYDLPVDKIITDRHVYLKN
ncbi:5-formyltetrahydrofolate cyclo-ligase [Bacillus sp. 03113]|uniref:5-formyltetrahydrofolate cyclo-ligase n=1 Tax=Bacillus sp. 03113 TaxID=2578211 RepID=UPI001142AE6B|nr:5-formyltetrahydrofolate cyclo-ligase [Bacillus sp. 03113]